ncbi:MAG: hypothetical protein JWO17_1051 [Actinomycetia bacterium]|nr:hypothetical protein [Actinomycetes bacterium]
MSLRKLLTAAAAVTGAFAIGTTATAANAATAPIIPPVSLGVPTTVPMIPAVPIGIPDLLTCPSWYGFPNSAASACTSWRYYLYHRTTFPLLP